MSEIDFALKHKTDLEMILLYKNLTGKDVIPDDYKERVRDFICNDIPVTDVDCDEVARFAATVSLSDKKTYKYVKGQFSGFVTQTLFENGDAQPKPISPVVQIQRPAQIQQAPKPKVERVANTEPSARPKAGSSTGMVWDIADELSKTTTDEKALRKAVIDKCVADGINKSTASVQFGKWKAAR